METETHLSASAKVSSTITECTKTICVLGLGYIGLPTGSMFATHGMRVIGVDINPHIVDVLTGGGLHIEETGVKDVVREAMKSGNLVVRRVPEPADVFIIAVPTPINQDKTADMRAVTSAAESIVPHLAPGNLVILESTSPPRTTVDLVRPILERSALTAGRDFLLAYSPERVLPGQILKELVENPRVIGGIDRASAEAGRDLYTAFVKGEIVLTDATTAEMIKLMENTFRDVNIALANEFGLIAEKLGVNVWEAIDIANRHPRVKILRPGPGVGGHCIAVDPWFLVEAAPDRAQLIRQARRVNDAMPKHVVEQVKQVVAGIKNPAIACLGLTFKADIDDTRESPAVEVVKLLKAEGFDVRAFDPHVKIGTFSFQVESLAKTLDGATMVVLLTDHSAFKTIPRDQLTLYGQRTLLDTRNLLNDMPMDQPHLQMEKQPLMALAE
ncbi:MAG: nucleotide sugar dehydrogenase [Chloroflexi bacterium]|nr:nucleotide sugar dehydrogenase [Chloroflexota bacterium]